MKKTLFLIVVIILVILSCGKDDEQEKKIIDGSGNTYNEIEVGNQTWLREDLKTGKYINGQDIQTKDFENKGKEGYYYSYNVDMRKLCPKGYKVPSQSDFQKLIEYFGGENINKDQIIASYVSKWNGNTNGNGDGFTNSGSGLYWSSTETFYSGQIGNYYFYFRTQFAGISVSLFSATGNFHIKCIKE